jgi:hypothetical protein
MAGANERRLPAQSVGSASQLRSTLYTAACPTDLRLGQTFSSNDMDDCHCPPLFSPGSLIPIHAPLECLCCHAATRCVSSAPLLLGRDRKPRAFSLVSRRPPGALLRKARGHAPATSVLANSIPCSLGIRFGQMVATMSSVRSASRWRSFRSNSQRPSSWGACS